MRWKQILTSTFTSMFLVLWFKISQLLCNSSICTHMCIEFIKCRLSISFHYLICRLWLTVFNNRIKWLWIGKYNASPWSSARRDVTYLLLVGYIEYFWADSLYNASKLLVSLLASVLKRITQYKSEFYLKNPILYNSNIFPLTCDLERDAGPHYVNFDYRSSWLFFGERLFLLQWKLGFYS